MAENTRLAGEFIVRLFHARTAAHILHLKTQSYAEHKALNDFYDSVVDFADSFAECYTGEYLQIMDFPSEGYRTPATSMALISGLTNWIKDNRDDICDSPECQNIIDEVLSLCHSTAYKLKFLK
jgi:hypothetical protein